MLTDAQVSAFRQFGVLTLPQLFAFDEVAWLREAAVALAQRHGAARDGRGFAPASIRDVHQAEPGFRKLAAHPRLVEPLRQLFEGDVVLRETRLCIGTGFDILANSAAEISAVVFLDVAAGAGARLGSALLVDGAAHFRDPRLSSSTLAFVATFARARSDADWLGPIESDDCLWPTPFMAAG
jgi:hypothetical protein